jgi:hypothetical protein
MCEKGKHALGLNDGFLIVSREASRAWVKRAESEWCEEAGNATKLKVRPDRPLTPMSEKVTFRPNRALLIARLLVRPSSMSWRSAPCVGPKQRARVTACFQGHRPLPRRNAFVCRRRLGCASRIPRSAPVTTARSRGNEVLIIRGSRDLSAPRVRQVADSPHGCSLRRGRVLPLPVRSIPKMTEARPS